MHFHALIRLDGPDSRDDPPPLWASSEVLADAVASAAAVATVTSESAMLGRLVHRFGEQLDVHQVTLTKQEVPESGTQIPAIGVAVYISKYTTKGTEAAHGCAQPIKSRASIELEGRTEHVREQMRTLWDLGAQQEYQGLNLRMWCHDLGFAGQITTKSRRYSTTYAALRKARADFRRGPAPEYAEDVITESRWVFVRQGYSEELQRYAEQVADDIEQRREIVRDAINDLKLEAHYNSTFTVTQR